MPGIEFTEAFGTIEAISLKTRDFEMYSDREKALRDNQWALAGARREGRREGRIQLLQELLNENPATDDELRALTTEELTQCVENLQTRLRQRNGDAQ